MGETFRRGKNGAGFLIHGLMRDAMKAAEGGAKPASTGTPIEELTDLRGNGIPEWAAGARTWARRRLARVAPAGRVLTPHLLVALYCIVAVASVMLFQHGDGLLIAFTANQVGLGHVNLYAYFTGHPALNVIATVMPPFYYLVTGAYFKLLLLLHWDPITSNPVEVYRTLFGVTGGKRFLLGMILFKVPNVAILLVGLVLMRRLATQLGASGRLVSILWLASPVMIVSTLMQAQNDVFPSVATIGALLAYTSRRRMLTMLLIGVAAALKNYALILIPVTALLLSNKDLREVVKLGAVAVMPPLACMLPFFGQPLIQRVFLARDGGSLLTPVSVGPLPIYLWATVYGALLLLAWSRSTSATDLTDLAAIWLITLVSVFAFAWWFTQWTLWIIPPLIVLTLSDRRLLTVWVWLNGFILVNMLVNSSPGLDGAMLLPVFGQAPTNSPEPIYGHLFLYNSVLPAPFRNLIFTACIAGFGLIAYRAFRLLVTRPSVPDGQLGGWSWSVAAVWQALSGSAMLIPYVAAAVAQHYV